MDGFKGTETSIPNGFDNVNVLIGTADTDSLTGTDLNATWNILNSAGDARYTVGTNPSAGSGQATLNFSALENLVGGAGDETFIFADGAKLPGIFNSIDAKAGNDTLDYSAYTTPVNVYLTGGIATGVTGGVSGFENVIGSLTAGNIIYGDSGDNILVIGAGNDILIGYGGDDTYVFDADAPLGNDTIDEQTNGGGIDTIDFSSTTTLGVSINISISTTQAVNAKLTLTILGTIEKVIGTPLADTITGNLVANTITGGAGNDTLNGLGGSDTYLFSDNFGVDTLSDTRDSTRSTSRRSRRT